MLTLIIIIIIFFLYKYYTENMGMVYCRSDIDGRFYQVRDLEDKQDASNLLARIYKNMFNFSKYLLKSIKNHDIYSKYIVQLNNNIKNIVLRESAPYKATTSYTVNKGEIMVLCIRTGKFNMKQNFHDINLIMYVVLHEMSHIACPEYDHTDLFKKIFNFFCKEAIKIGLYEKIDFKNIPHEYCGILINNSII
jgi:hypothetical protein